MPLHMDDATAARLRNLQADLSRLQDEFREIAGDRTPPGAHWSNKYGWYLSEPWGARNDLFTTLAEEAASVTCLALLGAEPEAGEDLLQVWLEFLKAMVSRRFIQDRPSTDYLDENSTEQTLLHGHIDNVAEVSELAIRQFLASHRAHERRKAVSGQFAESNDNAAVNAGIPQVGGAPAASPSYSLDCQSSKALPTAYTFRPTQAAYNSDSHWLWGWGDRIERLGIPSEWHLNEYAWLIFRPSSLVADAMICVSAKYPQLIQQIDEQLEVADRRFSEFMGDKAHANEERFAEALRNLGKCIKAASELIGEAEASGRDSGNNSVTRINTSYKAGALFENSPADKNTERAKPSKRSTARGEARTKLIAALSLHHEYANGSCLRLEPIGNNNLARQAGVTQSTASEFFSDQFGGHDKYRAACNDSRVLLASLKLLNQEFSPRVLLGNSQVEEGRRVR